MTISTSVFNGLGYTHTVLFAETSEDVELLRRLSHQLPHWDRRDKTQQSEKIFCRTEMQGLTSTDVHLSLFFNNKE